VLISSTIDAHENRDVATVDLPGDFMQADMDEVVRMKLVGTMAELLVKIDQKRYSKFLTRNKKGIAILYVLLRKALYGTLKAALIFWRKLKATLGGWGFVVNPYDCCVAKKIIEEKQCTILWHVDDLKISHEDPCVVSNIIELIRKEFGKEAPLTETSGKQHDYLGMTIDYSISGKVQIIMVDYIKNILTDLPADMEGISATPASNHRFTVNNESPINWILKSQSCSTILWHSCCSYANEPDRTFRQQCRSSVHESKAQTMMITKSCLV
jgi:hypothetical protein